jgi:hypothetical protein
MLSGNDNRLKNLGKLRVQLSARGRNAVVAVAVLATAAMVVFAPTPQVYGGLLAMTAIIVCAIFSPRRPDSD